MEPLLDARGLTEEQAIARYRSKNYPKPALTADIVILRREADSLRVLLIRRGGHPFLGKWAFPGGFADENEPVEQTALRELEEETGVTGIPLELVDVFSRPGRDPRGWTVSVAFCAQIGESVPVRAGDDAAAAAWFTVARDEEGLYLEHGGEKLRSLAFDHWEILEKTLKKTGN